MPSPLGPGCGGTWLWWDLDGVVVKIGDAAAFAGTTPRDIRHHHEIGLLPEPERGVDGRRYGYDDMIRILWIRKMAGPASAWTTSREQAIEAAGLGRAGEKLFEIYDADLTGEEDTRMSAGEAVTEMPYGLVPARMRCMERTEQLLAQAHAASS
uniref:MerR family transcriptional regulator n=1 Tax=Paractinoplanes polyasparticus TaxID=2856853 RepID=UPI0027E15BEB|nr:MerR family transcriptional regulator [Actinoplanes polyasparticus]